MSRCSEQTSDAPTTLELYEMATERENDLVAFRKFVDEQLSNGRAKLTLTCA